MNDFLLYHHLLAIIIWQVSIDIRWDKRVHKWDEEERKWKFMATVIFTVAFYALGLSLGKFNSTLR